MQSFKACLCFRYRDGLLVDPTSSETEPQFLFTIEDGGFIENTGTTGECNIEGEARNFLSPEWDGTTGLVLDYE